MKRLDALADAAFRGQATLLVDVLWLTDRLRELESILKAVEYSGDFCDDPACPICLHRHWQGHQPECSLAAALKAVGE